jgi:hypothetical protein
LDSHAEFDRVRSLFEITEIMTIPELTDLGV